MVGRLRASRRMEVGRCSYQNKGLEWRCFFVEMFGFSCCFSCTFHSVLVFFSVVFRLFLVIYGCLIASFRQLFFFVDLLGVSLGEVWSHSILCFLVQGWLTLVSKERTVFQWILVPQVLELVSQLENQIQGSISWMKSWTFMCLLPPLKPNNEHSQQTYNKPYILIFIYLWN